jgi:hypothetical protein
MQHKGRIHFTILTILFLLNGNILKGQSVDIFYKSHPKPNWNNGTELVYIHLKTLLSTNEQDMPVQKIVDTTYTQILVDSLQNNTYRLTMNHFFSYNEQSRKLSDPCTDLFKNGPIKIRVDSSFRFISFDNWKQWSDTLLKNLKREYNAKRIDLNTYAAFQAKYKQEEEVKNIVLSYYEAMFSFVGKEWTLWTLDPIKVKLLNPFSDQEFKSDGNIQVYAQGEKLEQLIWRLKGNSTNNDKEKLAQDYIQFAQRFNPNQEIAPPLIKINRDEILYYDLISNQITSYRKEESVSINGATEHIEYHLMLKHVKTN